MTSVNEAEQRLADMGFPVRHAGPGPGGGRFLPGSGGAGGGTPGGGGRSRGGGGKRKGAGDSGSQITVKDNDPDTDPMQQPREWTRAFTAGSPDPPAEKFAGTMRTPYGNTASHHAYVSKGYGAEKDSHSVTITTLNPRHGGASGGRWKETRGVKSEQEALSMADQQLADAVKRSKNQVAKP